MEWEDPRLLEELSRQVGLLREEVKALNSVVDECFKLYGELADPVRPSLAERLRGARK
jgi:hypothetical protein